MGRAGVLHSFNLEGVTEDTTGLRAGIMTDRASISTSDISVARAWASSYVFNEHISNPNTVQLNEQEQVTIIQALSPPEYVYPPLTRPSNPQESVDSWESSRLVPEDAAPELGRLGERAFGRHKAEITQNGFIIVPVDQTVARVIRINKRGKLSALFHTPSHHRTPFLLRKGRLFSIAACCSVCIGSSRAPCRAPASEVRLFARPASARRHRSVPSRAAAHFHV